MTGDGEEEEEVAAEDFLTVNRESQRGLWFCSYRVLVMKLLDLYKSLTEPPTNYYSQLSSNTLLMLCPVSSTILNSTHFLSLSLSLFLRVYVHVHDMYMICT